MLAPGTVFETAVSRVEEITLGVVCAAIIHSLIFPKSVFSAFENKLRSAMAQARRWIGDGLIRQALGSAEFKANAHRYMAEWARRPPFYALGKGPPQVVVGRYADVHRVFSDTETFKSEMPRGAGWEQFNKVMFAQFVTQMDGEQHARVRRLLMPAFSSRRIEQLQDNIIRIVDGMLDRIEANGPEFDGMQQHGAHLVVDALLDAMVNMDQRRKAIFVAFHDAIPGTTYVKPGESWSPELRRAFDRTMEEVRAIIEARAMIKLSFGFCRRARSFQIKQEWLRGGFARGRKLV